VDIISLIGFLISLIGIPSSLYAFLQIRREIEARNALGPNRTAADVAAEIAKPGERVLIEFQKERAETSGTFEHAVMTFVRAYPDARDSRWLLRNPIGVLQVNDSMLRLHAQSSVTAIVVWLGFWIVLIVTIYLALHFAGTGKSFGFLGALALSPFFIVSGLGCGLWAYKAQQYAAHYKMKRDLVQEYLTYLREREIEIGVEFTQSKRMFENEQAEQLARAPPAA
jgi:hypothetical protein